MKVVILFSMKSCPHCVHIKELFDEHNIPYVDRDIHEYEEEYGAFAEAKNNEYVPALMLMTLEENNEDYSNVKLLAPDDDYEGVTEALELVRKYLSE